MNAPKLEWAEAWLRTPKLALYADNHWKKGTSNTEFTTVNPANQKTLTRFVECSAKDVSEAVSSAQKAFKNPAWRQISRKQRSDLLRAIGQIIREHAAELATLESLDNGKTYKEAFNDDLPESADVFDYYAGWTDKYYGETCPVENGFLNYTLREPMGVCALIVPWNFPLLLACWKIAPALAMGNTIIVKPAPFTSLTLIRLTELLEEKKVLPSGVFNLVLGGAESGNAISSHPGIQKISFTGSTATGGKIVQGAGSSNLKNLTLELGGKSPVIVFADSQNLDAVTARCFQAMFSHKGEKCSEPTRFIVEESIYSKFSEALIQKANAVKCGNPFEASTEQGPQCHKEHFEKILKYIDIGKQEGAKLLAGGQADTHGENAQGFFIRPTIFGDTQSNMRIVQEEIFGPVVCLQKFKTEEQAIELANATPYGLAAGAYTSDPSKLLRLGDRLEAGMVFLNHYGCYHFASPFGGFKQSGWGKEMGIHSLQAYTKTKSVWIKYAE